MKLDYLSKIPTKNLAGVVVVHNNVRPTRRLGQRGFRHGWLSQTISGWWSVTATGHLSWELTTGLSKANSNRRRSSVARNSPGQIIERTGKNGRTFAIRYRAGGKRHYETTTATTRAGAEQELAAMLLSIRRGTWRPP